MEAIKTKTIEQYRAEWIAELEKEMKAFEGTKHAFCKKVGYDYSNFMNLMKPERSTLSFNTYVKLMSYLGKEVKVEAI